MLCAKCHKEVSREKRFYRIVAKGLLPIGSRYLKEKIVCKKCAIKMDRENQTFWLIGFSLWFLGIIIGTIIIVVRTN